MVTSQRGGRAQGEAADCYLAETLTGALSHDSIAESTQSSKGRMSSPPNSGTATGVA